MRELHYRDLQILTPVPMWNALKDRYDYMIETGELVNITFEEYLDSVANYPQDLLEPYLEWEGIIGYTETLKEFILNFLPFFK